MSGELTNGVILTGIYQQSQAAPSQNGQEHLIVFPDGATQRNPQVDERSVGLRAKWFDFYGAPSKKDNKKAAIAAFFIGVWRCSFRRESVNILDGLRQVRRR